MMIVKVDNMHSTTTNADTTSTITTTNADIITTTTTTSHIPSTTTAI